MEPWVVAVLAFLGGSGGLGGVYALVRHSRNTKTARIVIEKCGVEGLEAACRLVHPVAEASRVVRQRRAARQATTPRKMRSAPPAAEHDARSEQRDPAA